MDIFIHMYLIPCTWTWEGNGVFLTGIKWAKKIYQKKLKCIIHCKKIFLSNEFISGLSPMNCDNLLKIISFLLNHHLKVTAWERQTRQRLIIHNIKSLFYSFKSSETRIWSHVPLPEAVILCSLVWGLTNLFFPFSVIILR